MLEFPTSLSPDAVQAVLSIIRGWSTVDQHQLAKGIWNILGFGLAQLFPAPTPALLSVIVASDTDGYSRGELADKLQSVMDADDDVKVRALDIDWVKVIKAILQLIIDIMPQGKPLPA